MEESPPLRDALQRYVYLFLIQASQTALANALGSLEQRLARWLLMAHDRVPGNELPLTHELLARTIGARRAGVSIAFQKLEQRGFIATARGQIRIVDRDGLEQCASPLYGVPERELERLFSLG